MTIKELIDGLHLTIYEYCNKRKVIEAKEKDNSALKLNEIMLISQTLDEEQISFIIDENSDFINLFDNKI